MGAVFSSYHIRTFVAACGPLFIYIFSAFWTIFKLTYTLLAFFEPGTLALAVDYRAMVRETVKDGRGDGHVGKDPVPLGEDFVAGKDGGNFLVASGDELEKEIGSLNIHGEIADFVDNK